MYQISARRAKDGHASINQTELQKMEIQNLVTFGTGPTDCNTVGILMLPGRCVGHETTACELCASCIDETEIFLYQIQGITSMTSRTWN